MPTAPSNVVVVEFKRPDRLADPTQFLADDFEDEDIQPVVKKLAPICDGFRQHAFAWHYEIGKVVRKHFDALKKRRTSMYGERFFNRLAVKLKRPNVSGQLLANCFRLVKQYSEQEYLRYVQQPEVSPTHLLMLAGIDDRQLREELVQQVIDDKLTTSQLYAAIKEKLGIRRPGKPGRPLKVPKNVTAGLTHLDAQAEKFIKLNNDCWFGERFDLADEIGNIPADKLTPEFKGQLSAALKKCETLAEKVNNDVVVLRKALAEVEKRMAAQAALNARVAEEELEEQNRVKLEAEQARHNRPPRQWKPNQKLRIGRERRIA